VRDALAAVRNLETLLRSTTVRYTVIQSLLPELGSSAALLRETFEQASSNDSDVTVEVGRYGEKRVADLQALLDGVAAGGIDRDDVAAQAGGLADGLQATADLLALLERAASPAPTTVSVQLIVRELARPSGTARAHEIAVRLEEGTPDFAVDADPYVVGGLLSLVFALVRSAGAEKAILRAETGDGPAVVIEGVPSFDNALRILTFQVLPPVEPSAAVARKVASRIGIALELGGTRAMLRFATCTG
jgi:hypothetical protein